MARTIAVFVEELEGLPELLDLLLGKLVHFAPVFRRSPRRRPVIDGDDDRKDSAADYSSRVAAKSIIIPLPWADRLDVVLFVALAKISKEKAGGGSPPFIRTYMELTLWPTEKKEETARLLW